MNIQEYSEQAITTLTSDHDYGEITPELMAQVLGLVGESGEVAEKFKKLVRDKYGVLTDENKAELLKELGDIVWYVNSIAILLGSDLEAVLRNNLKKVLSRKERGVTKGSGDNR